MDLNGSHLGISRNHPYLGSPPVPTDNVHSLIPNGYGPDSRNLDTTFPRSPVDDGPVSWFSYNEMGQAIYPNATAQPTYTQSSILSLLSPSLPNPVVRRDPGLDDNKEKAWKHLPNITNSSGHTGRSLPQHITSYADPQPYFTELKSEDIYDGDLTLEDRQVFQTHTSGTTFGEMALMRPGSYLRYSADGMQGQQGPIPFDFAGKITKGFFHLDNQAYTYRRNYFETTGSLTLLAPWGHPHMEYMEADGESWTSVPVHGFAVGISAFCAETESPVTIYQFSTKRDNGNRVTPKNQDLPWKEPTPVHCHADGLVQQDFGHPPREFQYSRLQFATATPNNGKRVSCQRHFRIRVSLYIKEQRQTYTEIAYRDSDKIIVRGRSPGHYREPAKRGSKVPPPALFYFKSEFPESEFADSEFREEVLDDTPDAHQGNGDYGSSSTSLGSSNIGPNRSPDSSSLTLPPLSFPYSNNRLPDPWAEPAAAPQSLAPYSDFRQRRGGDWSSVVWAP